MSIDEVWCKHGLRIHSCTTCTEPAKIERTIRERNVGGSQARKSPDNSDTYFGHTWSEWFALRDIGFGFLVERARGRRTATYNEIWTAVGTGAGRDIGKAWRKVPQLLRHISDKSLDNTGLILTALVITDGRDGHPSEGFFRLSVRVGFLDESDEPEKGVPWNGMTQRQRDFWMNQVEAIFDYYDN